MRLVPFQSALYGVATLMGLDPLVNLLGDQAAALTGYINDRVYQGWRKYDWPELILIENRAYKDAYNHATSYTTGQQVYNTADGNYYQALQNTTGNDPPNATYWTTLTSFNRYIPYNQTGMTPIFDALALFRNDPRISSTPRKMNFLLSADGVQAPLDAPATVYLKHRLTPSTFNISTVWNSSTAYTAGTVVYENTTGDCYTALVTTNAGDPVTNTAKWQKIPLPAVLARYATRAAYADALREDGQNEKADREEAKAENFLMDEFDVIEMQSEQYQNFTARTAQ